MLMSIGWFIEDWLLGVFLVLGFLLKLFLVMSFDLLLGISDSVVFYLDHLFVLVSSSIIDIVINLCIYTSRYYL